MSKCSLFRLKFQREYQDLLVALRKFYGQGSASNSISLLDAYGGALDLLKERYGEEGTASPSPEDALNYLLDASIERFGYSARDVFGGVFGYLWMTGYHDSVFVNLSYNAVFALAKNGVAGHSISHKILALRPADRGPLVPIRWNVDFKSDWVARSVLKHLDEAEDDEILRHIRTLRMVPELRGFAGRFLEPIAHRRIATSIRGLWTLANMDSSATDAPKFTLNRDSPVPDNVRFVKVKRNIVKLEALADLSTCLENNTYYVPTDPNFPLFDAFTIELDHVKKLAILWILQITTSRLHGGSALGYQRIREIITMLKDKLREGPPAKKRKTGSQATPTPLVQVEVRYLLVVPKDTLDLQWQFPEGWDQNVQRNDHRGEVYCLEVPLSDSVCSTIIKKVFSFEHIVFIQ